ncbi:hypothetical protein [Bradyrhizobium centrolobii]|uniref:hypothetical protein n=1 Tax=Bradyrhizobium centrolobii TaxID=1505087 RepID=UPI0010A9626A|nr:hypothetical protein [Bradyrhizobium centrolobii]
MLMTAVLTILISARTAAAQTYVPTPSSALPITSLQRPSLGLTTGSAPIGHRQPKTTDVPTEWPGDLERLSEEDVKIDRRLTICRGC